MLEGPAYLVSRELPSSCEQESKWIYNTFRVIELSKGKRRLEDGEDLAMRKASKPSEAQERGEIMDGLHDLSFSPTGDKHLEMDQSNSPLMHFAVIKVSGPLEAHERGEIMDGLQDLSIVPIDQPNNQHHEMDQSDSPLIHFAVTNASGPSEAHGSEEMMEGLHDLSFALADQPDDQNHEEMMEGLHDLPFALADQPDDQNHEEMMEGLHDLPVALADQPDDQNHEEMMEGLHDLPFAVADQPADQNHERDYSNSPLIHQLGRDISINCLLRCSRSDYGNIASLNWGFRHLIRSGELYRLRRESGIVEHWVYYSCNLLEWEAFDPIRRQWMNLPKMSSNECFMCSDKESLAVGTELLVFGKEIMNHVIFRYSILTNTWSSGMKMNTPRCLFGSASLGEIAILAGGCDPRGNILSSAELYNSETGTWETIPSMNKARKMCSGVFMDGKFYVIGGIGVGNSKMLTCGEVYDLSTRTWREIPNMFPARNGGSGATEAPAAAEAPPLVAVVNNELYAADYAQKEVRKYDKERNLWVTLGTLPERAVSMNGWGLAFRACGDRLIVIGGPRNLGGGMIELNSWVPSEGPPQWDLLARKPSCSFVYNCAVMGC